MNCPIKERDMKALAVYQDTLMRNPRLRYIFFELTDCCNLRCLHCGSSCDPRNQSFLPYSVVEKTLRSILREYDPHSVMVCLTGGEPVLHPDLNKIIRLSHKLGFPVGMTTNGTLIYEGKAEQLAEAGLDTVAVSIDGTREIHDIFRCSSGSFEKAMNGVKALQRYGIEPQAITVASKMNLDNLPALGRFLADEGFYSWRITNIDPIGRADKNRDLLLDRDEMIKLLAFIREMRYSPDIEMEVTYGCSHFLSYDFEREVRDFYFQCGAGLLVGSVMANGDIGACLDIERRKELIQGNACTDDFLTVWKERFKPFRMNRAEKSDYCAGCKHQAVCRGDSAHTWDYDKREPRYCLFREERA